MSPIVFQVLALLLAAQQPGSPASADRKLILDALHPVVEQRVGAPVEFVVTKLRVDGRWAFIQAEPQRPGGHRINGARYFPGSWADMDGLTTTAILRRQGKAWQVREWRIGATDAWYCGLPNVGFDPCRK